MSGIKNINPALEFAANLWGIQIPQNEEPPPTPDYSAAMTSMSGDGKTVALAQIQGQEFAMQQASADREMQTAANLELGLERLDTQLQTSKMDFMQAMTAEQNRHMEKMAAGGIPEPAFEGAL